MQEQLRRLEAQAALLTKGAATSRAAQRDVANGLMKVHTAVKAYMEAVDGTQDSGSPVRAARGAFRYHPED